MKQLYFLLALLMTTLVFAQTPQGFNYQATVRDNSGELVVNQNVNFKFNVIQGSQNNDPLYSETHQNISTDDLGQVGLVIGEGTATTGVFSEIDWSLGVYFLKIELDTGSGYVAMGTSQMLSVPYALYAEDSGNTYSKSEVDALIDDVQSQIDNPNGATYCDLGSPTEVVDVTNPATGKTWMDRNLGASQVATSSTDEAAYGDLYQWGRNADGHQCRNSPTTSVLSPKDQPDDGDFITTDESQQNPTYDWRSPQNDNLWQGVNGVNNPCPTGYRLPTEAELEAERLSWVSNDASGAIASPLKLPMAHGRDWPDGGPVYDFDEVDLGFYWSSTISDDDYNSSLSVVLVFTDDGYAEVLNEIERANGASVRCIKD